MTFTSSALRAERPDPFGGASGLFSTRYTSVAANTIDYWMLPDDPELTEGRLLQAVEEAPVLEGAELSLYVHVPFCAQRCAFCAFSGGNSLDFKQAERYSRLVVEELHALLARTRVRGHPIRAINVGGGAPELLGDHIGHVLRALRDLPGFTDATELSVEMTLSTARSEFVEQLVRHDVMKVSFGLQTLDPEVRRFMRQPATLAHLDRVLGWIDGRIPVVNADLITGLPGHDLATVARDLRTLIEDPRIHAISSYLLTAGAAPSLLALARSGRIPERPAEELQAMMRLHTYSTLLREGWVRCGTNTYVDPRTVANDVLARLAGHECIGAPAYETFLLGVGPQAVSSLPGARLENRVDVAGWARAVESGEHPFFLSKCSTVHQKDTALWAFPLRAEGLPRKRFEHMLANGALSVAQLRTLETFIEEGLVVHTSRGHELSILGEVFMGHLVRDLKKEEGRRAVDEYVAEGERLADRIASGQVRDGNDANNRQRLTQADEHAP